MLLLLRSRIDITSNLIMIRNEDQDDDAEDYDDIFHDKEFNVFYKYFIAL